MINSKYAKAYTEVLEVRKYFSEEDYNKIPKKKIEFYKENMDKNYDFTINPDIDLSEQNISPEANAIMITLYRDHFATEEQKEKIKEILELNEKKAEQEKRKKYNPDNLFKRNNSSENKVQETALVKYKENFFIRFKNFIMNLLHLKN